MEDGFPQEITIEEVEEEVDAFEIVRCEVLGRYVVVVVRERVP